MVRTRQCLLACMAAVVALAVASEASANSVLKLAYNSAKDFGAVDLGGTGSSQGAIDVTNGAMIVTTSAFKFIPVGGQPNEYGTPGHVETGDAAIHDAIVEGYNGGTWNGTNGIFSSAAANDSAQNKAVGWVDNDAAGGLYTSFRGANVPPGSSIIGFTYLGDGDMSGSVDIADYFTIGNTYGSPPPGGYLAGNGLPANTVDWYDQDTDYNGVVDIADYFNVGNTYGLPALYSAAPIVPSAAPAVATVPEPTTFVLIAAAALFGLGVRLVRKARS